MTEGVELTVGDSGNHPMRQLQSNDHAAASGSHAYTSGIYGGPVVRFSGVFN
jgi:hypothetical protein